MKRPGIKAVLAVLLALVFGAGQVCACTSPAAGHASHRAHEASPSAGHDHFAHHDPYHSRNGCPHCTHSLFAIHSASVAAPLWVPLQADKFVFGPPAAFAGSIEQAPERRGRISWLEPPPTSPVALNIRLLN